MDNRARTSFKIFALAVGLYYIFNGVRNMLGLTEAILIVAGIIAIAIVFMLFNRGVYYHNRAGRRFQKGDTEGALTDLEKAVHYDAKNVNIRGSYAFLLLKVGQIKEASLQIDEALANVRKKHDDKNGLTLTKAMVLWKEEKLDEAIDMLSELIKTFETTDVYATLGFLYIEKGDYDKAIEFNLKAKEYNNDNAVILDNLGCSYYLSGDYDTAYELYQGLMKLKPSFPEAFYNYAKVLEYKGELEKALYIIRHSLTLKFWHTNTISKTKIEEYLAYLEAKEEEIEKNNKVNRLDEAAASEEIKGSIDNQDVVGTENDVNTEANADTTDDE